MAHIIQMHSDPHRAAQELLPWYVTGQLDPADHASVESHLSDCAECRAELKAERALACEVAGLSLDAESGWSELRRRMALTTPRGEFLRQTVGAIRRALAWPGWMGWLLMGQTAVALSFAVMLLPYGNPAPYRTLGDAPLQRVGNVIVIFRPDASEQSLRRTLVASRARLVDGPTSAGAYVLYVPAGERYSILSMLRKQPDVVLAQPVDAVEQP